MTHPLVCPAPMESPWNLAVWEERDWKFFYALNPTLPRLPQNVSLNRKLINKDLFYHFSYLLIVCLQMHFNNIRIQNQSKHAFFIPSLSLTNSYMYTKNSHKFMRIFMKTCHNIKLPHYFILKIMICQL